MGLKSSALLESNNLDLVDVVAPNNGNAQISDRKRNLNTASPINKIHSNKMRPPALAVPQTSANFLIRET